MRTGEMLAEGDCDTYRGDLRELLGPVQTRALTGPTV